MSLPNELHPLQLAASSGGYDIEQSLRFNSPDSAYLNRTPGSAGNRKTWTWSGWIKLGKNSVGTNRYFFVGNSAQTNTGFTGIGFTSDKIFIASWTTNWIVTTQVFRDYGAWYHIVLIWDTTQATANDRVKLYVNGNRVTDFFQTNNPTQDSDGGVNAAAAHYISTYNGSAQHFDGYLAEVNFIDGSALTPTSFGEEDDSGVWRPIKYAGSYTGNSFYLKFASGDGTDSSGLSNTWTANNFTTSGTGTDVMSDTPTTNYATLNPPSFYANNGTQTLTEGNLKVAFSNIRGVHGTIPMSSGKFYWEATPTEAVINSLPAGIVSTVQAASNTDPYNGYVIDVQFGRNYINGSYSISYGAFSTDDILSIALDLDNGKIWYAKNGTWLGTSADPAAGTGASATGISGTFVPVFAEGNNTTGTWLANFGQRAFEYTPPSGFKALNTRTLPAPDIKDGSDYLNTVLYSGNATSQSLTVGFQPDLIWTKPRNAVGSHVLVDAVRGNTKFLESNADGPEQTRTGNDGVTSFDTSGYSIGSAADWNASGETFVSWNWLAANGTETNEAGSITSTVSANPSAGFSIVSYTGTGVNATVGHGLGVAPKMVIVKKRSSSNGWIVGHSSLGWTKYIALNDPGTDGTSSTIWQDTAPTSSVFSVGTNTTVNGLSATFIAYCFAEVEGYSKISKFTGDGTNGDGPFVYCGFAPAFILVKANNAVYNWSMYDSTRSTFNASTRVLFPNLNNQEVASTDHFDWLSNGFKIRGDSINPSNTAVYFMAFAENPFGGFGVSPATAR